jgi:hypothetical protein
MRPSWRIIGSSRFSPSLARDSARSIGQNSEGSNPQGIVPSREDVDLMSRSGETPGDLRHVDVLAAAVGTTERGERRCMFADPE